MRIHFADYGDSNIEIYGAAMVRGVDPHKQIIEILTPIPFADLNEKDLFTIVFRPGSYFPRPLIVDVTILYDEFIFRVSRTCRMFHILVLQVAFQDRSRM